MSYIAFHSKRHKTVKVRGSERAHMGILVTDMAASILPRGLGARDNFTKLIPENYRDEWTSLLSGPGREEWLRTYLGGFSQKKLIFNGAEHNCSETALNTVLAMDSDVMSLMCKIDGTCESHGWFPSEDHNWFASVMEQGLDRHILRSDSGWEDVIKVFQDDLDEPIVMSYSVCDEFPNPYFFDLDAEACEAWYENQSDDEQWDSAMAALREMPYLEINSNTLNSQWFLDAATLWDAMESPEWRTP